MSVILLFVCMEPPNFAPALRSTGIPVPAGFVSTAVYLRHVYDAAKALGLRVARSSTPETFIRARAKFLGYTSATRVEITPALVWRGLTDAQRADFARRYDTSTSVKRAREPDVPASGGGGIVPLPTEGGSSSSSDTGLMDLPTEMRTVIRRFLSNASQAHVALVNKQFATEVGVGWHLLCQQLVRHFHRTLPKDSTWIALEKAAKTGEDTYRAYSSLLHVLATVMGVTAGAHIETFGNHELDYGQPGDFRFEVVRDKRDFAAAADPNYLCRMRSEETQWESYYFRFVIDIPEALLAEHPRLRTALGTANAQLAAAAHTSVYTTAEDALAALFFVLLSEVDPLAVQIFTETFEGKSASLSLLGLETNGIERKRTVYKTQRLKDLPHWRDLDDEFFGAIGTGDSDEEEEGEDA